MARLDIMSLEDGHILNFRAALGRPDGGVNCVLVLVLDFMYRSAWFACPSPTKWLIYILLCLELGRLATMTAAGAA